MLLYTAQRVVVAFLVAVTVSLGAFVVLHLSGDIATAMAGPSARSEDIEFIRHAYGLDRPLWRQYIDWAGRTMRGDFGQSFYFKETVAALVRRHLPVTMTLGACALGFALALSIPLGALAALRPNTWVDRLALLISVLGQALPSFWFSLLMILLFGVTLHLLPISGTASWKSFVLPAIALGYYATPALMRLTRSGMLEVMSSDFIRMARAKGLGTGAVVFRHALRNAIIPVVSVTAVQFGFMLGGSVVIETVFALNGLGYLAYQSISRADYPVVQAVVLILSLFYVALTLLADLLNAFLDPRIRID